MKRTCTLIILLNLLLSACAPMGASIVVNDKTISNDRPRFLINFKKQPIKVEATGSDRKFYFSKDEGNGPVLIGYHSWIERNNLDYYLSLPHIAAELNYIYLGPAHFAGHEWAKVAQYQDKYEVLKYGYLTRKDNALVYALDFTWNIERETKHEFKKFTETRSLSNYAKQEADSKIGHLDEIIEIVY